MDNRQAFEGGGEDTSAAYRDPRAHELRARYEQRFKRGGLPVAVEAIAEDLLGLHLEDAPLNGLSGFLLPGERRIVVNTTDVETRRRFTVAHELGHWVCQCLDGRAAPIYCRHADVDAATDRALEREANIFAAELLMPELAVRAAVGTNEDLAALFDVSVEAMTWRLYSFDLGPPPRRDDS